MNPEPTCMGICGEIPILLTAYALTIVHFDSARVTLPSLDGHAMASFAGKSEALQNG